MLLVPLRSDMFPLCACLNMNTTSLFCIFCFSTILKQNPRKRIEGATWLHIWQMAICNSKGQKLFRQYSYYFDDLSENIVKNVESFRLKEGSSINKSLMMLGQVRFSVLVLGLDLRLEWADFGLQSECKKWKKPRSRLYIFLRGGDWRVLGAERRTRVLHMILKWIILGPFSPR